MGEGRDRSRGRDKDGDGSRDGSSVSSILSILSPYSSPASYVSYVLGSYSYPPSLISAREAGVLVSRAAVLLLLRNYYRITLIRSLTASRTVIRVL